MNSVGFLILLERPDTLGKKDKTVKYLTPSCSFPSSSSSGTCPWCPKEFRKDSADWDRLGVSGGVKTPGQVRGQSSCDAWRRMQEEVRVGDVFPGRD